MQTPKSPVTCVFNCLVLMHPAKIVPMHVYKSQSMYMYVKYNARCLKTPFSMGAEGNRGSLTCYQVTSDH